MNTNNYTPCIVGGDIYTTDSALFAAILRHDGNRFEVELGDPDGKFRHLRMRVSYGGGRFWSDWQHLQAFYADDPVPDENTLEDMALSLWFDTCPVEFASDDMIIETAASLEELIASLEADGDDARAERARLAQLLEVIR